MTNPANSTVQNLLPVQAYFDENNNFVTFIGQNKPFYATIDPIQSGLHITNSTIDSTTIGATTPSTAVFVSGQVNTLPIGSTDITNKQYVDSVAAGLSWKAPVATATASNITLSGLQTIDGYTTLAGDRVLVKSQSTAANNGIYLASAGAWSRAPDADTWNEYISAITFVQYGTLAGSAWYCSAQPGGTLGVTAINWSNFSVAATYTAGTGLTLTGYEFSITNTGATAGTYGTAARNITQTVNAQGQITNIFDQPIAIANTQVSGLGTMSTQADSSVAITGGSIDGTAIGTTTASTVRGSTITATTQFTGAGTGLTGTATGLSIGGSAASATTATTATNLAGGATGSLPYQTGSGATTFLGAGTNGQVLTLASGVPTWSNAAATGVTSVSGTGTVSGITLTGTVTSSGSLTLGGTLDLSSPPAIGGTTANTISGTTITATTQFTGAGTGLTGTATSLSIGGNAATATSATSATTSTNLAGGANGSVPYQTGSGATSFLAAGTNGYVLTLAAGVPTWAAAAGGLTVSDDTTTNATRYPLFANATSGSVSTIYTSSTKYKYNPSTGDLTAPQVVASNGLVLNASTNTASYTIASGQNAMSVGPFTTATGTTITVPSGSRWVVL